MEFNLNFITIFLQISVERGMSWEEATKIWAELTGPDDGFYLLLQVRLISF